jgi:hypothetical protein
MPGSSPGKTESGEKKLDSRFQLFGNEQLRNPTGHFQRTVRIYPLSTVI